MSLAVFASLLALLVANSHAQLQCEIQTAGKTYGGHVFPRLLDQVTMEPGVKDYSLEIAHSIHTGCSLGTRHVGTEVRACDGDVPPAVRLHDHRRGLVSRRGAAAAPCLVTITIFCEVFFPPHYDYE